MSTQYPGIENDEPEAPPGPIVGEVPGLEAGNTYPNRKALHSARVHNMLMHGISTDGLSIVMSGGYVDDLDEGDQVIYTGEGGRRS